MLCLVVMLGPVFSLLLLLASLATVASLCGCCDTSGTTLSTCSGCPSATTALHLGNCGLSSIQPGAFTSPSLSRVTAVDLSNNALRGLSAAAFSGLINLDLLNLSFNYISDVAAGALSSEYLPVLASLDLGYNMLREVPRTLNLPNLTSLRCAPWLLLHIDDFVKPLQRQLESDIKLLRRFFYRHSSHYLP